MSKRYLIIVVALFLPFCEVTFADEIFQACGKEWRVGREKLDWNETQTWINSLGGGWQTPMKAELKELYIKVGHKSPISSNYAWAESKDSMRAWFFFFGTGIDQECSRTGRAYGIWAIAVRPGGATQETISNSSGNKAPQFGTKATSAKKSYLIAEAVFEKGQYYECLTQLNWAVESLGETNPRIQCLKVNALYSLGNIPDAKKELEAFFSIPTISQPQIKSMVEMKAKIEAEEKRKAEIQPNGEAERSQMRKAEPSPPPRDPIVGNWIYTLNGSGVGLIEENSVIEIVRNGAELTIYATTTQMEGYVPKYRWKGSYQNGILKASAWHDWYTMDFRLNPSTGNLEGKVNSSAPDFKFHNYAILKRQ
ncbi:hypothetical protein AUK22_07810 [bacterium CG2_30_54_10]|nr:MAG: hypothetical protein AUK22_07810 [bacterium CG2_30_54_10]